MDGTINELLQIQVLLLQMFRDILELDEMIMMFRQRIVTRRRRRRASQLWVRQWLRGREDRGQNQNLTSELYQEDQLTFRNFMWMSPGIFSKTERRMTTDLKGRHPSSDNLSTLQLVFTLRHLATGQSDVSFHNQALSR